ncbi:MAG: hypothetical protein WBO70_06410, partial [Erysipelotrichaceae bacterium]
MKALKINLCLILCFLLPISTYAENQNSIISEDYTTIIVYANSNDRSDVERKASEAFKKFGKNIIVEVRDYEEAYSKGIEHPDINPTRVSNYRSYFIGHLTYSTDGRISCYVAGDSVWDYTSVVNTYG